MGNNNICTDCHYSCYCYLFLENSMLKQTACYVTLNIINYHTKFIPQMKLLLNYFVIPAKHLSAIYAKMKFGSCLPCQDKHFQFIFKKQRQLHLMHLFLTYYGSYYDETEKLCKECNEKYLQRICYTQCPYGIFYK
eukprot:TRINITY_DN2004_c0_g1_i2.p4 TRINITY_DN2004_c0_g1~~TRINITY_DN2004_c0_g1_i2.p4  ORF type:complete len:136 (-),score=4.57 TRINITY_DN2004_c0_g1_i2:345-752(-)